MELYGSIVYINESQEYVWISLQLSISHDRLSKYKSQFPRLEQETGLESSTVPTLLRLTLPSKVLGQKIFPVDRLCKILEEIKTHLGLT